MPPPLSGNTQVTVALTGTANDQLLQFGLELESITLTGQKGNLVNLLVAQQPTEFIHLNGDVEPLTAVTIPQDIYSSATAIIGGAWFTCTTLTPSGSLDTSTFAYGYVPNSFVTVNLPSPITVTGDNMDVLLDMLVSQSETYSACYNANGTYTYSITPTFNLTKASFSQQPTNPENGKVLDLNGEINAINAGGSSFTLALPFPENPRALSVASNTGTVYQGSSGFSALAVGTFVEMDGAIQSGGSLLATRIAVNDPAALNVMTSPLTFLDAELPDFYSFAGQQQGQDYSTQPQGLGVYSFSNSTVFQISGELGNLAELPFPASFSSSNMVDGQNIAVYSLALTDFYGGDYTAATTITLMPQTINGTVTGSSVSGIFTDYSVSLAPYDLFPNLAVQQGQTTQLNNPADVEVYVDSNTQLVNSQPLAESGTFRFYGLVFNDNGTLRMDCAQVNDGVNETPQSSASQRNHEEKGEARRTRRDSVGPVPQTIHLIKANPQP